MSTIDAEEEEDQEGSAESIYLDLFHHLSASDRAWLCKKLLADPDMALRYLETFISNEIEPDIWFEQGFVRLVQWLASGRMSSKIPEALDERYDVLSHVSAQEPTGLAQKRIALARRTISPRKKLSIVCSARNEGVYLVDWIAYHRAIGFEEIFVYTNDNDDGSDMLLEHLCEAGLIRLIKSKVSPGTLPQFKAYGHAHQLLPDVLDYEWTAVIDLDEYIRVDDTRYESLWHYIELIKTEKPDCIQLPWVMCALNGQSHFSDRPVLERFPSKLADKHTRSFKSLFRMNQFIHNSAHVPIDFVERRYVWENGRHYPAPATYHESTCNFHAWIDHHYYKSVEEYILRKTLNTGDHAVQHGHDLGRITDALAGSLVWWFCEKPIENSPDQAILAKTSKLRMEIRNIPNINEAHENCVDIHRSRASKLLASMAIDARFQRPNTNENVIFNLLTGRA